MPANPVALTSEGEQWEHPRLKVRPASKRGSSKQLFKGAARIQSSPTARTGARSFGMPQVPKPVQFLLHHHVAKAFSVKPEVR